jgi:hypothetical protein
MSRKFVLISISLFCVISSVFALDPIGDKLGLIRARALPPQSDTTSVLFSTTESGIQRDEFVIHRIQSVSGGFIARAESAVFRSFEEFAPDLSIVSSSITEPTGDRVTSLKALAGGTVIVSLTTKGKTREKAIKKDKGLVFSPEIQYVQMQAWAAGIREGYTFRSPSPDGGSIYEFEVRFVETAEPLSLSTTYIYPAEFSAAFKASAPFIVAEMRLKGLAATFYPHVMRFIYLKTDAGLVFRGYWGGAPATASFQYLKD